MTFEKITPIYTGGGIYCFTGKIKGGAYFLASDLFDDITELDTDPDEVDINEVFEAEWQAQHMTKTYNPEEEETTRFFISLLKWIIKNKPNGTGCNYSMYDIEKNLTEYQQQLKKTR